MYIRFIRTKKFVQRHRDLLKQESTEKEFKTKLNILQDESVNNNNNVSDITDGILRFSEKKLGFMDLIVKECDVNGNYSGKEIVQEVATMLGVTQPACLIYIIAGIINLKKTNFN